MWYNSNMKKKYRLKKFNIFVVMFGVLMYEELIFRIINNIGIFNSSMFYVVLFNIILSIFISIITKLFNEVTNRIIFLISLFMIGFIYCVQLCVYKMFGFYFEFSLMGASNQVTSFMSDGIRLIIVNIIGIILLLLPFILFLIGIRKIHVNRDSKKNIIIKVIVFIVGILLFNGSTYINGEVNKLYRNVNNIDLNIRMFGVINSFIIDVNRSIFDFQEVIEDNDYKEEVINSDEDYEYNNLSIDFDKLIDEEDNEVIKSMHEYFKSDDGTKKNKYTNYFGGKNLVLFMAESFNEIAVDKNLTPTLYKLVNSGFVFNNFYTPTISSTIGGEFQELTGLVAASGFLSPWKSGSNYYPFGIARVFNGLGYNTYAYHNNSAFFQNRNVYLKAIGFEKFLGCYNGLEKKINCKTWPQSDVEMIRATISDYINSEEPFFTYYVTVSGHGGYSFSSNAMAKKNKKYVEDLNYSESVKSYLAAQIELDRALEELISELDKSGKLNDTVIALVGDHYPYYLSVDEVNEVSSYKKDSIVTINKSNFILWNNEMKNVIIDKVGSEIDVLPTIYNLFGAPFDSRLIIGKDILSTEAGLAIFGNRSWVSDKGIYYSQTGKFVGDASKEYIEYMNNLVDKKMMLSKNIMVYDYYRKVLGD